MHRRASIPSRINIIGEHTDYLQGLALPFAGGQWLELTAKSSVHTIGTPTVVALWNAAGGEPAELTVVSTIPIGAGMSSSAALCLAVVMCAQNEIDAMGACREAQRIEHEVLGTPCGLLDQMAMMFGEEDHAVLLDFSTETQALVRLPATWLFKLVDSGVRRQLNATDFGHSIDEIALQDHALTENERVRRALNAEPEQLGTLLNESHASLQTIGVSHPLVDEKVALLQATPGVLGARMMGGGFGGMILTLVSGNEVLPEAPLLRASKGGFVEELLE
jgi:galactokinase